MGQAEDASEDDTAAGGGDSGGRALSRPRVSRYTRGRQPT